MVPSFRMRGLARTGPTRPAGRCSAGDQVLPSSVLNLRAAVQVPGLGAELVVEPEASISGVKQDRVPAGHRRFAGELYGVRTRHCRSAVSPR